MIIETITNSTRAISLIKNDVNYQVLSKEDLKWTSFTYDTLLEALNKFNELCVRFNL